VRSVGVELTVRKFDSEGVDEFGQAAGDGVPQDIEVHVIVSVDQPVSQSYYFLPRNLVYRGSSFGRHASCRFANDPPKSRQGELELSVGRKVFSATALAISTASIA
jgi:hypothetical protein